MEGRGATKNPAECTKSHTTKIWGIIMYKMRMIYVLFLTLIITNGVWSQKIIRRTNKFVLIEITLQSEIKIGDQFNVYRSGLKFQDQMIAKIKILRIQGSKCAGEIISESEEYPINVGDFLKLTHAKNETTLDTFNDENLTLNQSRTQLYTKKSNNLPRYLSVGAGILSCGLGYSFYNKANTIYSDYKSAKTAEDATRLYNDTVKYDKSTNIALGIGAGLIVLGVIYPILKSKPSSNPKYSFDIYSNYEKIRVTVNLPLNMY